MEETQNILEVKTQIKRWLAINDNCVELVTAQVKIKGLSIAEMRFFSEYLSLPITPAGVAPSPCIIYPIGERIVIFLIQQKDGSRSKNK